MSTDEKNKQNGPSTEETPEDVQPVDEGRQEALDEALEEVKPADEAQAEKLQDEARPDGEEPKASPEEVKPADEAQSEKLQDEARPDGGEHKASLEEVQLADEEEPLPKEEEDARDVMDDIAPEQKSFTEKAEAFELTAEGEEEEEEEGGFFEPAQLEQILEGILFVSGRVMTIQALASIVGQATKKEIRETLKTLETRWNDTARGVHLVKVNNGYQFRSDPVIAPYMREMLKVKPLKLSKPALETLAIIAYRQPIIRAEIEEIRGVDSGGVIRTLMEKKLIRPMGKREIPGRPMNWGTTREFLEVFNLSSLKDLPTLTEFHELTEEHRAKVEASYGREDVEEESETQDALFAPKEFGPDESHTAKKLEESVAELDVAMSEAERSVEEALNASFEDTQVEPDVPLPEVEEVGQVGKNIYYEPTDAEASPAEEEIEVDYDDEANDSDSTGEEE